MNINRKTLSLLSKLTVLLLAAVLLVAASACDFNFSSYSAIGLVQSNKSDSAFISFISFKGEMKFTLKCAEDDVIQYQASLEEGTMTVYIEFDGEKTELFTINSGEEFVSSITSPGKGKVKIIIKSEDKCKNGSFKFYI